MMQHWQHFKEICPYLPIIIGISIPNKVMMSYNSNRFMQLLLYIGAPLVLYCDRFDCGSRQVLKCELWHTTLSANSHLLRLNEASSAASTLQTSILLLSNIWYTGTVWTYPYVNDMLYNMVSGLGILAHLYYPRIDLLHHNAMICGDTNHCCTAYHRL